MKIFAFAGSNSRNSINKALISYAATLLTDHDVEIIDLNDYEMPLFSVDREQESGVPEQAHLFYKKIGAADALLISLAEHNGNYTAAYKNLFDWASRIGKTVYQGKPTVLLSSSPGARGAGSVLAIATTSAPYIGLDLKASLSIPNFYDNFDVENGRLTNSELHTQLETALATLT